jgi:hypothetical protein
VWILAYLDLRQRNEEALMDQMQKSLVRFGVMGLGQLAMGLLTVWGQKTISDWLFEQEKQKYQLKPIRGFQKTPML